ncbi:hypothetical protein M501DRAFT_924874 [Patellaria atrata CBS 101060]|uniref:Uncharacterized protein n=1 Tax=Patellaria atrata CBS 101060 TaxID=1346257 RepID=A0A9P4SJM7_9PEZI|nr:hypothetical protein M501DRAFT_924874 [Patellaria atrata CBS 101060]
MAPVEGDTTISNLYVLAHFYSRILLIGLSLGQILPTLRNTWRTLPPAQDTRLSKAQRTKQTWVFASAATGSFVAVSYHAIVRRVFSYLAWSHEKNQTLPNTLWTGWYAKEQGATGWQLGNWMKDAGLDATAYQEGVLSSKGFWWVQQQYIAIIAWSVFVGIEGHRRNFPKLKLLSFVALAQLVGLSFAQNLFFVAILSTPLPLGSSRSRKSSTWTPHPAIYIIPTLLSLIGIHRLPLLGDNALINGSLFKIAHFLVPAFFTLVSQIVPISLGSSHKDTHEAHRSYTTVFSTISGLSFLLHALQAYTAAADTRPPKEYRIHEYVWNMHRKKERSNLEIAITIIERILGVLSTDPYISMIGWDVLLCSLSLALWAVARHSDINKILKLTLVPWMRTSDDEELESKKEKHVTFDGDGTNGKTPPPSSPTTKRTRRGRPRKDESSPGKTKSSLRRSTRRKPSVQLDSDSDDSFKPTPSIAEETAYTEHDEVHDSEQFSDAGECAALSWGLFVLGGLGMASAGVLGAEVLA